MVTLYALLQRWNFLMMDLSFCLSRGCVCHLRGHKMAYFYVITFVTELEHLVHYYCAQQKKPKFHLARHILTRLDTFDMSSPYILAMSSLNSMTQHTRHDDLDSLDTLNTSSSTGVT